MKPVTRHTIRRVSQFSVFAAFAVIPWLNAKDFRLLTGNLLSATIANIPLADPLAALQVLASTNGISIQLLMGACIALTLALIMGPVFCSWICPYGLVMDLIGKRLRSRNRNDQDWSFPFKWAFFGLFIVSIGALELPPLLNHLSLPGWYTRTTQALWLSGTIPVGFWLLPVATAVDMGVRDRFWCRYVCPQSLLLETAGRLLPRRFRVLHEESRCSCIRTRLTPCQAACPLGIDPKKRNIDPKCTNCGDCVVACTRHGKALSQGFGPRRFTPEDQIS